MFLVYINDLSDTIRSEIRLFADDTTVYAFGDDPIESASILNTDLETINKWATKWLVKFSPEKTKSMIITRKNTSFNHPPLIFGNVHLEEVISHKHLGLTLQSNLAWHEHINGIITNASKKLDIMQALKYKLDRKTLEVMYFSFIRPLLEYGDVIWDNSGNVLSDQIEKVQVRAARIVSGGIIRAPYESMLKELGWTKLSDRRKYKRLIYIHKIQLGQAPSYLSDILPPSRGNLTSRMLRGSQNITGIRARTEQYKCSLFPKSIDDYNNLDISIRSLNTSQFAKKVKGSNSKRPKWFDIGNRKLSIIHSKLRMECSSLNAHLFKLNIIDNQLCSCGLCPENNFHFFFECRLYEVYRITMLNKLQALNLNKRIDLNFVLFGDINSSFTSNKNIVLIIQEFIEATKRFTF